jgi:hypothetical protein
MYAMREEVIVYGRVPQGMQKYDSGAISPARMQQLLRAAHA